MANREDNIKTKLEVSGEKEYRAACKGINTSLREIGSELKLVTAEYATNASSMEALTSKQDILKRTLEEQAKKAELAETALRNYRANGIEETNPAYQRMQTNLNNVRTEMARTQNQIDAISDSLNESVPAHEQFVAAAADADAQLGVLGAKLKSVSADYANNADSAEAMHAQMTVLKEIYDEQSRKVTELEKAYQAASAEYGENSTQALNLKKSLYECSAEMKSTKNQIDKLDDGLKSNSETTQKAKVDWEALGGAVAKGAKALGVGMAALATAAAAGAYKLGTAVVESYGEYEQLAGGVETLFGSSSQTVDDYAASIGSSVENIKKFQAENGLAVDGIIGPMTQGVIDEKYKSLTNTVRSAQDIVMKDAANAFSTAGLSANEYMETATGFAASLINGLGGDTVKAAELTNKAILDMADNANKTGTDMSSIQNAYQGFAKGNYTMLDNLKLGYGGTNEEMVRLINDSGILNEKISSMDGITFDQVISAIHAVQDGMGMSGVSADEAINTIQGSMGALGAAFDNLLTGLGTTDADIQALVGNVAEYLGYVINNITPVIENIVAALPTLFDAVIENIAGMLPVVVETATTLFNSLLSTLIALIPELTPAAVDMVMSLVDTIIANLPLLIDGAVQLVGALVSGIGTALPTLIPAAVQMITEIITGLIEAIPMLIEAADDIILGLADGLLAALPDLIAAIPQIIIGMQAAFWDAIPDLVDTGIQLLSALVGNIPAIIDAIVTAIPDLIMGVIANILDHIPDFVEAGVELLLGLVGNVGAIIMGLVEAVPAIITGLFNAFTDSANIAKIGEAGAQLWNGLVEGISNALSNAKDAVVSAFSGVIDWVKELFGIHSPSTVFASIGDFLLKGLGQGLLDGVSAVLDTVASVFGKIWDAIKSIFGFGGQSSESKEGKGIGSDIMSGVKGGIEGGKDDVEKAGQNAAKAALDAMAKEFGTTEGASTKTQAFGENLVKGINAGLGDVSADDFSGGVGKITEALETAINDALGMQSTGFFGWGGKSSEKFSGVGDNIISAIADGIEKSKGGSNAVKTAITGVIDEAATAGTESAKTNGSTVGEHIITAIADKIAADVGTITGKIPAMTTTIVAAFDARLADYIAAGQRIADKLAEGMDGNVTAITGKVDGMTTEIITTYEDQHGQYTDEGTAISDLIAEAMAANVTAITDQIPGMTQDILAALESHHPEYTDEGVQIDESVRTGMANKAGALTNEMNQIMIQIKGVIDGYNGELYACGRNMADGIWSGMRSMRSTLISRVRSMMQDIVAAVKDEMDINSPSKVFAGIGRYMAMGLGEGFGAEMRNTDTLIRRAVDGAVPGVQQYGGRSNNQGTTFAITQNVYANDTSYVEQQRQAAKNFRQIAREIAI